MDTAHDAAAEGSGIPVRVLLIEDMESDAILILRELTRYGYVPEWERVDTREGVARCLSSREWDIVFSDHSMPRFNSAAALSFVKRERPDLPFIIISGAIDEETAVDSIRAGASDYLLKDRLTRLGPAVDRALREAAETRERARAEDAQRKLEAQLRHAQRLETIGQLASGVVHDVNTMLTVIGIDGRSARRSSDSPLVAEHLDRIIEAAQQASDTLRQVLVFSRSGEITRTEGVLSDPVRDAVRLLETVKPHNVQIELNAHDAGHMALYNAVQVQQLVMNLVTNAWQAMGGRPGHIGISVSVSEKQTTASRAAGNGHTRQILLRIADDGPGMEESTRVRIFEPFFTTKPAAEGTGLGLAVVQKIVQEHGARVNVQSAPGNGTVFEVVFPESALKNGAVRDTFEQAGGKGEHVLVVDDHPVIREGMHELLEIAGYRVSSFGDPFEAITMLENPECDARLVITDFSMSEMSGAELARRILSLGSGIPVILMSAYDLSADRDRWNTLNIRRVLPKPIRLEELTGAVAEVLTATAP